MTLRVNQERIVLIIAVALFVFFSVALNGFLAISGQSVVAHTERLHPRHPRRRHGVSRHRPRHRSGDRRHDGDVGGLAARHDERRHADRARRRLGARLRRHRRPDQRLSHRLCRDSRDLRDAGDGHSGLWLRQDLARRRRRRLSAGARGLVLQDRQRPDIRRALVGDRIRGRRAARFPVPALSEAWASSSTAWETIRLQRASQGFRYDR